MAKGKAVNHSACRRGTIVKIKLRNGDIFTDRFLERKGGNIILEEHGRMKKKDMIGFMVYKG